MELKKPVLAALGVAAYIGLFFILYEIFLDKQAMIRLVDESGILGPAIIIALYILQAIVFFLPGNVVAIASGFLFGFWNAIFLNLVGTVIGTALLFLLARKASKFFGYSRIVLAELDYIKGFFRKQKHRRRMYVLTRAAPIVPGDTVTIFIASFTKNPFPEFILFTALGAIPKTALDTFAGVLIRKYGILSYPVMYITSFFILLVITEFILERKKGLIQRLKWPWKVSMRSR